MDSVETLKAKILFKLARRRNWGGSHTAFDNLKRGFHPKDHGAVKECAERLIREGFLVKKPTGYGLQVSLNHQKSKEIKQIIYEFLGVRVD